MLPRLDRALTRAYTEALSVTCVTDSDYRESPGVKLRPGSHGVGTAVRYRQRVKGFGEMADGKQAGMKDVREFFGMSLPEMKAEWVSLPDKDKADILAGLSDGTLTY